MYDHWTEEHYAQLPLIDSLPDLGRMGIKMAAHLKLQHRYVAIVCGPMTTGGLGSLDANMARHALGQQRLRKLGIVVFNQAPFQEAIIRLTDHHNSTEYDMRILEDFYRPIFLSRHITHAWFLPGWEGSKGAAWERDFLLALPEVSVLDFPSGYFQRSFA